MKNVPFRFKLIFAAFTLLAAAASMSSFAQNISSATLAPAGQFKPSPNADYVTSWDFKIASPSVLLTDRNLRYGLKLLYQASPLFGVEASVNNLRTANAVTGVADPFNIYASAVKATARGYGLDLVSTLPVMDRLSITARAGVQAVRSDANFSASANLGSAGADFNAYGAPRLFSQSRLGLGVQYSLTKSVGLRLELERYYRLSGNTGNTFGSPFSADNVSIGLQFKF